MLPCIKVKADTQYGDLVSIKPKAKMTMWTQNKIGKKMAIKIHVRN